MSPPEFCINPTSGGDHASMGRRLLTTEQAVRAAGVKAGTLHQWARRGHIKNYGDGHRALWDMAELDTRLSTRHRQSQRVA